MDNIHTLEKEIASLKEKLSTIQNLIYLESGKIEKGSIIKKNDYDIQVFNGKYNDKSISMKEFPTMKILNDLFWDFSQEIKKATKTSHPNVPHFYGVYFDNIHVYLVYELIKGKSLKKKCVDLNLKEKVGLLVKIVKIICDLHDRQLSHKGLRTSKFIIEESNNVFLKELGDSDYDKGSCPNKQTSEDERNFCAYYAPEKLTEDFEDDEDEVKKQDTDSESLKKAIEQDCKFDVWSLGCIISEICSGVIPWSNYDNNKDDTKKHASLKINKLVGYLMDKKEFPIPSELTNELKDILSGCFKINIENRISSKELLERLEKYYDII